MDLWPYHAAGHPNAPPLLFLHGFMGAGQDWQPIAAQLTDHFFCLMPDLPGHGRNHQLPSPLDFDTLAAGLHHFISHVANPPVNLVGYSMGGRLALYAAVQFPALVNRLVLEGANPGLAGAEERTIRAALDDKRAARLQAIGIEQFVEEWYEMGLFESLLAQPPTLLAQMKARRKQNNTQQMAAVISALSPGRQPPLWSRLAELSMPVLLLAGALDQKYAALVQTMARQTPQVAVEFVPQAGHNTHLEQPEQFVALVKSFLTDLPAGTA